MKYKIHHEKETQGLPYNVSKKRIKEGGGGWAYTVWFSFVFAKATRPSHVVPSASVITIVK